MGRHRPARPGSPVAREMGCSGLPKGRNRQGKREKPRATIPRTRTPGPLCQTSGKPGKTGPTDGLVTVWFRRLHQGRERASGTSWTARPKNKARGITLLWFSMGSQGSLAANTKAGCPMELGPNGPSRQLRPHHWCDFPRRRPGPMLNPGAQSNAFDSTSPEENPLRGTTGRPNVVHPSAHHSPR